MVFQKEWKIGVLGNAEIKLSPRTPLAEARGRDALCRSSSAPFYNLLPSILS